jgi:4-hydroxythreonine-4-phosphate dehydrogenase
MSIKNKPLIITTGDSCGIGLEVTTKAVLETSASFLRRWPIVFVRKHPDLLSPKERKIHSFQVNRLKKKFKVETLEWSSALDLSKFDFKTNRIVEILSCSEAPLWVEWAARACLDGRASALVTGPLSKGLIAQCGMSDIGHTEILKRVSKIKNVYMLFLGSDFNVVLLTGHIPLSRVSRAVRLAELDNLLKLLQSRRLLNPHPAALLGLNPHAGDGGLLGREELTWMNAYVKKHKKYLIGPLPADSAFCEAVWKKTSIYIALYHDQGLIPFKLHHGFQGCHFSLGLPFVRTSVDHGTAFDIFSKDKANACSMKSALQWAGYMAQTEMTKTSYL